MLVNPRVVASSGAEVGPRGLPQHPGPDRERPPRHAHHRSRRIRPGASRSHRDARASRPAACSTRSTTSTACCSSTAWTRSRRTSSAARTTAERSRGSAPATTSGASFGTRCPESASLSSAPGIIRAQRRGRLAAAASRRARRRPPGSPACSIERRSRGATRPLVHDAQVGARTPARREAAAIARSRPTTSSACGPQTTRVKAAIAPRRAAARRRPPRARPAARTSPRPARREPQHRRLDQHRRRAPGPARAGSRRGRSSRRSCGRSRSAGAQVEAAQQRDRGRRRAPRPSSAVTPPARRCRRSARRSYAIVAEPVAQRLAHARPRSRGWRPSPCTSTTGSPAAALVVGELDPGALDGRRAHFPTG